MISVAQIAQSGADRHRPGMQLDTAVLFGNRHPYPAESSLRKDAKLASGDERRAIIKLKIAMHDLRVQVGVAAKIRPIRSLEWLVGFEIKIQRMLGISKKERRAIPVQYFSTSTQRHRSILSLIGQVACPSVAVTLPRHDRNAPLIGLLFRPPLPEEACCAHHERRDSYASLKPLGNVRLCHSVMISRVGVLAEAAH